MYDALLMESVRCMVNAHYIDDVCCMYDALHRESVQCMVNAWYIHDAQ